MRLVLVAVALALCAVPAMAQQKCLPSGCLAAPAETPAQAAARQNQELENARSVCLARWWRPPGPGGPAEFLTDACRAIDQKWRASGAQAAADRAAADARAADAKAEQANAAQVEKAAKP